MKKFLLVICIVLGVMTVLAACAPLQTDVESYARALPGWVIIAGAIVLFFIGFGLIWKLIPGFIKFIALIALVIVIAGVAYGLWNIPLVGNAIDSVDRYMDETRPSATVSATASADATDTGGSGLDIHIDIGG